MMAMFGRGRLMTVTRMRHGLTELGSDVGIPPVHQHVGASLDFVDAVGFAVDIVSASAAAADDLDFDAVRFDEPARVDQGFDREFGFVDAFVGIAQIDGVTFVALQAEEFDAGQS